MRKPASTTPVEFRATQSTVAAPAGSDIDDATLVSCALGGERWAEEAIYRRHVQFVTGVVIRLLRNRSDVDDVVQDTFVTALQQVGTLRDRTALRGWLAQIAASKVRHKLRHFRVLAGLGLDGAREDSAIDDCAVPGQHSEARAELAAIDRLLATLPSEQRLAWMHRYVEGESLDEVARACDCSLATAKRRVAAADARVRVHVSLDEISL